jgi:hypothetical protein
VLSLDPFLMMRVSSSSLNSATGTSRRSITCVLKLVFLFSFRSIVFLTQLGGNAFGNDASWIEAAMRRALRSAADWGLIVKLVSFSKPSASLQRFVQELG